MIYPEAMGTSLTPKVSKSRVSWLVATFFGIGYLQPGSGTWASAVTLLLWWAAARLMAPSWVLPAAILLAAAITLIGIPPSTTVARESGRKDPGFVVIDEVAGQIPANSRVHSRVGASRRSGQCGLIDNCCLPKAAILK